MRTSARTRRDLRHDYAAQKGGANNQADITKDRADLRSDRRDLMKDRADIRSDVHDLRSDRQDIHADRRDLRSDRTDLHADRNDLRSDHQDLRLAHNGGQPATDRRLTGEKLQSATAMNRGNEGRDLHGGTTGATHSANPQQLTAAKLASTGAENAKKPANADAAKKPWYHWVWW